MNAYTEPHADRSALLTIDVQRDFTLEGAPAEIPGTADAVPRMTKLVDAFRDADRPIVHVVRLYEESGDNVDACRRAAIEAGDSIVAPGSDGAEIVDDLTPRDAEIRDPNPLLDADALLDGDVQELGPDEYAMYKPRWSAFYETPLETFLRAREVDTVVVCGCNFPNCPRTTVYEASARDFRIVFVADATSGTYERGIAELEGIGVAVGDAAATVEWLGGSDRALAKSRSSDLN